MCSTVSSWGLCVQAWCVQCLCPSFQGGKRYCSLFVDESSLYLGTYFLVRKDEHTESHKKFCADTANYGGQHISEFHSDNGGEYMSKVYIKLIEESGARKSTIVPLTPNQNPIAEATFWRLFSTARALLKESGLPHEHWAAAVQHATYILNRTPKLRDGVWMSPYERLTGRKPNLSYIRIFGCKAQVGWRACQSLHEPNRV